MTFLGFLLVYDPPKPGVAEIIRQLKDLGVTLKIITGDNALVAANVGRQVGLADRPAAHRAGTAPDERRGAAPSGRPRSTIFAEVEPNQKERIILALRKAGNVVGYMGDGINDASALHAADVGISVDSAVDVAKEAADIVLLEKDLEVLVRACRKAA